MWCFSLFLWADGRLCSSDSWAVSVQDTPCLTGMYWKVCACTASFSPPARTEMCTTAYQSKLSQTPSNLCSRPIFETHNHHPNSNFLSCMETVLCLLFLACCADRRNSASLDQSGRFYNASSVRGRGFSFWSAGDGRGLRLLASPLGVFLLVYACMCAWGIYFLYFRASEFEVTLF